MERLLIEVLQLGMPQAMLSRLCNVGDSRFSGAYLKEGECI